MTMIRTALALSLAAAGLAVSQPAFAQETAAAQPKIKPSKQATKALVELQTAINTKDWAGYPAKLAAAQAAAKSKEDQYLIANFRLKASVERNDVAEIASAVDAIAASGLASPTQLSPALLFLGQKAYNAKDYVKAGQYFDRVLASDPNNADALTMLAETRAGGGNPAEGATLLQKAIAAKVAAGQKADENWYKRAVAIAYNAKLPLATQLSRDWVAAYPSAASWRDTIRIYENMVPTDDSVLVDLWRLGYATKSLAGENDYYKFASKLVARGFPGEAKTVLEQGFAANSIDRNKSIFRDLMGQATSRSQGDRASLGASAKTALAAAAAKQAMTIGDAYYGYGEYTQAAELYRAALTKSGVDANTANLRLGMALARAGDKAGASTAFKAVTGAQAEIAKYWLVYLAQAA